MRQIMRVMTRLYIGILHIEGHFTPPNAESQHKFQELAHTSPSKKLHKHTHTHAH